MKARLRNNRMSPGMEFDITEENRDGPLVFRGKRVEWFIFQKGDDS